MSTGNDEDENDFDLEAFFQAAVDAGDQAVTDAKNTFLAKLKDLPPELYGKLENIQPLDLYCALYVMPFQVFEHEQTMIVSFLMDGRVLLDEDDISDGEVPDLLALLLKCSPEEALEFILTIHEVYRHLPDLFTGFSVIGYSETSTDFSTDRDLFTEENIHALLIVGCEINGREEMSASEQSALAVDHARVDAAARRVEVAVRDQLLPALPEELRLQVKDLTELDIYRAIDFVQVHLRTLLDKLGNPKELELLRDWSTFLGGYLDLEKCATGTPIYMGDDWTYERFLSLYPWIFDASVYVPGIIPGLTRIDTPGLEARFSVHNFIHSNSDLAKIWQPKSAT